MQLHQISDLKRKAEGKLGEKGGIVIPALLWWMGVPLTLLIILYLFGVF